MVARYAGKREFGCVPGSYLRYATGAFGRLSLACIGDTFTPPVQNDLLEAIESLVRLDERDAHLHYLFPREVRRTLPEVLLAENLSMTSRGTGLLSILSGSEAEIAAQTLVSTHSTAKTFLLNRRCRIQKLLRRHSVTSDSTTTTSENRDGDVNDAFTSTRGIPTMRYVLSISRFRRPAFLNSAVVHASK